MGETKAKKRQKNYLPELAVILLFIALHVGAVFIFGMEAAGDVTLYELAEVTAGDKVLQVSYDISHLYTCMLSTLFLFLGNKWSVVVGMQLVLFLCAGLSFFAVAKKLFGRIAAVIFLLLSSVMPEFLLGHNKISPDILLGFVIGLVLAVLATIVSHLKVGGSYGWKLAAPVIALVAVLAAEYTRMTEVSLLKIQILLWLLLIGAGVQCIVDTGKRTKVEISPKEVAEENKVEETAKINYIPNPLPLPKKHVKKEIGFDYEPPQEQMEFDYPVKEGEEDFDIT